VKATITIDIDIDAEALALEAKRHGLSLERATAAVIADCENRLFDSIRFRDGVARVGSRVHTTPGGPRS
jgi:hypothetical protein